MKVNWPQIILHVSFVAQIAEPASFPDCFCAHAPVVLVVLKSITTWFRAQRLVNTRSHSFSSALWSSSLPSQHRSASTLELDIFVPDRSDNTAQDVVWTIGLWRLRHEQ